MHGQRTVPPIPTDVAADVRSVRASVRPAWSSRLLPLIPVVAMAAFAGCSKSTPSDSTTAPAASPSENVTAESPTPAPAATKTPAPPESGLPELPDLSAVTPDLAEVIRKATSTAKASMSADDIGRLGCVYHAIARTRPESELARACYELAKKKAPQSDKWPYLLGRLFMKRGSLERARAELNEAMALNPDYHRLHCWLGEIELHRGAGENAGDHFQRYIELEPEVADGYTGLAAAELLLGDAPAAYKHLTKALSLEPGSGWVHEVLASYHEAKGNVDSAAIEKEMAAKLPHTLSALRRDPYEIDVWRACGPTQFSLHQVTAMLSSGDGDSAQLLLEALLEDSPDNPGLLVGAARVYLLVDHLTEAEDAARKAIAANPKETSAYVVLSQIARRRGDYEDALKYADDALAIDGKFVAALVVRGRALVALKRYDEAVDANQAALQLEPENALHLKAIGEGLEMAGKAQEAKKFYVRAIEIGETNATFPVALMPVLANVARMEIAEGDVDAAIRHFDRVVRLNPGREYAFQQLVDMLVSVNRIPKAIEYCRNLVEQFPQSVSYGVTLADLLARKGSIKQAEEQLNALESRFPKNPAIPAMRGRIHARNEQYDLARSEYNESIKRQPQSELPYLLLAELDLKLKRPAEARAAMKQGLERSPSSASLANGLAWLLATCADESIRDPEEAIRLAESTCAGGRLNPNYVDTLACAYAAAGRFEDACLAERDAIDLAITQPYGVEREAFEARLAQFQNRQPFIEQPAQD